MATETIQESQPTNARPADINVDGRHDEPKNAGHETHGQAHDGPQMDLEPIGTGKVILFVIAFLILFAILFVLGLWPAIEQRKLADADANAAADNRPIVDVAMPHAPSKLPALQLPADAQPYQSTAIYPRTNGYLKRRLVDIGDHVQAGQLLAEIDTPEVNAQLAAAQANLQQANAAAQRAKDDFDLAGSTLDRYQGFAKSGGVTQQQLDERKSTFTQAKSALAGAQATVRSDEADVQRLTALQSYERVTAPFTGTITARNYDVGALLSDANTTAGKEMFDIAQTDILRIFVNVPQTYATDVKVGQPAQFLVNNFPGHPFNGKIARTAGAIDQTTRTLRVEVDCPNENEQLFAGMYGYVHYELPQEQKQLMIPSSALVFNAKGMQVALIDSDDKIKFIPVTVGRDLGTEVEITQGLAANDRIVANPGERLVDGVQVKTSQPENDNKNAVADKTKNQREASAK